MWVLAKSGDSGLEHGSRGWGRERGIRYQFNKSYYFPLYNINNCLTILIILIS